LGEPVAAYEDRRVDLSTNARNISPTFAKRSEEFGKRLSWLIRHSRAPLLSGGSAIGLSATGAWAEPLPVMFNDTPSSRPWRL
jgi:hypothetical protein